MTERLWELPATWEWSVIGDLGDVVSGGTPSTKVPEYWGGDVIWFAPSDLTGYKRKHIAQGAKTITEEGLAKSSAKVMAAGSVMFSSRAPVGYVAINSAPAATNQGFKSIVPHGELFNEYLYYYLKSAKHIAEERASGTTFKELSGSAFSALPVPIAPANEQRRIVDKIEVLFDEIDRGVESLLTAKRKIDLYRYSLLKSAFEGRLTAEWRAGNADKLESPNALLCRIRAERGTRYEAALEDWKKALHDWKNAGEKGKRPAKPKHVVTEFASPDQAKDLPKLPVGWAYMTVGSLCRVVRGGSPRPAGDGRYYGGEIPFLKVADLTRQPSKFVYQSTFSIKEAGLSKTRQIQPETLMISNSGATLGVPKICKISATFNDGIAAFLGLSPQENDFHYWFWTRMTPVLRMVDQGAAQPNLNTPLLAGTVIPQCSVAEQAEIVRLLNSRMEAAEMLDTGIDASLARAEALHHSILKRAFSGQLVPQDPTDEPASALLARIRAERDKMYTKGRKRRAAMATN